jgi:hypothetical protein
MKVINWEKLQQQVKKIFAIALLQVLLFGSLFFYPSSVLAEINVAPEANYQANRVNNGEETRSIPEQAKNAIDNGFSVFKDATKNSLEKLNPNDTTSAEASKFYDPIEGREAMDRENGR